MNKQYEELCEKYDHIMQASGIRRHEDVTAIRDTWFANIKNFQDLDLEMKRLIGKLLMIITEDREPTSDLQPTWAVRAEVEDLTFPEDNPNLSTLELLSAIDTVMLDFDGSDERLNYIIRSSGFTLTIPEVYQMVPVERKNFCNVNGCVYNYLMEIQ